MKEEDSRRPVTSEPAEDEGRALSVETVQQNLGVLGKNPYTLAFVFTTATLCDLQLVDLHAIGDFPNLQVSSSFFPAPFSLIVTTHRWVLRLAARDLLP
jgi:hypothetical protein